MSDALDGAGSNAPRPPATGGLRHVALNARNFEQQEYFYVTLLGMEVEWRPDADNVYLTSGCDNLALHRVPGEAAPPAQQSLDHIGFILDQPGHVDAWHRFLSAHEVPMRTAPRTHRDGARSFYCSDPDGNTVQMIFHPPISRPAG
jgi:catechol 2,3-dioxygenase-like lactoylglutathione lyase family enzyme